MHWTIALPFMICWLTAMVLINVYNDAPNRPLRGLFSWSHRISGVALIVLPLLAAILASDRDEEHAQVPHRESELHP